MEDWQAIFLLGAIMLAGLATVFSLYSGPNALFDDTNYLYYTHTFIQGNYTPNVNDLFSYSFGEIAILASSFRLFGVSIASAILPGILEYLLLITVVFLTARKLGGNLLAVISALFTTVCPFVIGYVTRILPDELLGLSVALSLLLITYAMESKKMHTFLFSGLILGFAVYVRIDALVSIFFYTVALAVGLWMKKDKELRRGFLYFLIGICVVIGGYLYLFSVYTQNPLFGIVNFQKIQTPLVSSTMTGNLGIMAMLLSPIPYTPSVVQNGSYQYSIGPLILLSIIGGFVALYRKDRLWLLAALAITVFFYYTLGSSSLSRYSPIVVTDKYMTIILAPISILAAYLILSVFQDIRNKSKINAAIALVVLLGFVLILSWPAYVLNHRYNGDVRNFTVAYENVLGYIANNYEVKNFTIYTYGDSKELQSAFAQFLTRYNESMSISPLPGTPCIPKDNLFLIIAAGNQVYSLKDNLNSTSEWTGRNCTLIPLYSSIFQPVGASLYQIENSG